MINKRKGAIPLVSVVLSLITIIFITLLASMIIIFFLGSIILPIPVFLKTFNIKFISRISEMYNLFNLAEQGEGR